MNHYNQNMNPTINLGAVETLCILVRLRDGIATVEELSMRLGLSKALAAPLANAVAHLVRDGYILGESGALSLTDSGRRLLHVALKA